MASTSQNLTHTPAVVSGLTDGSDYSVQNRSAFTVASLSQASGDSAPESGDARAALIPPLGWFTIYKRSGQTDYAWMVDDTKIGTITLHEIPSS